jgi:FkbM family methyltransferase
MKNLSLVKSLVTQLPRFFGLELVSCPTAEVALLCNCGITKILDIGANVGWYAQRIRRLGYTGQIMSFEPISSVFEQLKTAAQRDSRWHTLNYGLGDYDGKAVINVSENSAFSSLLDRTGLLNQEYFNSDYINQEEITVTRLDSVFDKFQSIEDKILLKIDVQGYEQQLLMGAEKSLPHIQGIQLELSFSEHYKGEKLFMDMVTFLSDKGFTLVGLNPLSQGLASGKFLQADGFFWRVN